MIEEVWKPYISNYDVSNLGRVRNRNTGNILKQQVLKNGYHACVVSCGSRNDKRVIRVHVAVAKLFVDNPYNLCEVNHKDGDKDNNTAGNLEWCTHKYNMKHAVENNLLPILYGEDKTTSVLREDDISYIRQVYIPRDRTFGARALARRYGVHHSTIEKIIHDVNWKNVA